MNFNWTEYLVVANHLYENPFQDAKDATYRTAISRAYYSAYWTARIYIEKETGYRPKSDVHKSVIKFLLISNIYGKNNIYIRDIGLDLQNLLAHRRYADYDSMVKSNLKSMAEDSLHLAQEIIDGITSLPTK